MLRASLGCATSELEWFRVSRNMAAGDVLRIIVPGPPVPKGRARSTRSGHHYTPERTVEYESMVRMLGTIAVNKCEWVSGKGPYELRVSITRARQAGDIDNFVKAISDGLNNVAFVDDRYIRRIVAEFAEDDGFGEPRVEVAVEELVPRPKRK